MTEPIAVEAPPLLAPPPLPRRSRREARESRVPSGGSTSNETLLSRSPTIPPHQYLSGTLLELVVETDGRLTLPPWLARALQLAPGELLALTPGPVSLGLVLYGEFLADDWPAIPDPNHWRYVQEFLSRPLVAVEERGVLAIPPELFPLRPGDQVCLQVLARDLTHELFLFREEAVLPETDVRESAD